MLGFLFIIGLISLKIVSSLHASCAYKIHMPSVSASYVNSSIIAQVNARTSWGSTCIYTSLGNDTEFCGYSIISLSPASNHFQHETPNAHYIDDIYMTVDDDGSTGVQIDAKSISEPNSYYDYDTNFCNIFNLLRNGTNTELNFAGLTIQMGDCTFYPSGANKNDFTQAYKTCDQY